MKTKVAIKFLKKEKKKNSAEDQLGAERLIYLQLYYFGLCFIHSKYSHYSEFIYNWLTEWHDWLVRLIVWVIDIYSDWLVD